MNVGNDFRSGLRGRSDGLIKRQHLTRGGKPETWAKNLVMPNGLALLPDGSALVTRDVYGYGLTSGITRAAPFEGNNPDYEWSKLRGTNGAAIDPEGKWLYVSRTFSRRAEIYRIALADPGNVQRVADLGVGILHLLDDLTFGSDGCLYVAADLSGCVYRVDIQSGEHSRVACGMPLVTAVKCGDGRGLPKEYLYATTMFGCVYELIPRFT